MQRIKENNKVINKEIIMLNFQINAILEGMLKMSPRVSDLNFSVYRPPQVEVDGQLKPVPFKGLERLKPFHTETLAMHLMGGKKELVEKLWKQGSADFSYSIPGKTRFRVNVFFQRGSMAVVLRVIPEGIPTIQELNLPEELLKIADLRNGIVLVTGPTGSGKSTTLAAIIHEINQKHAYHVVTIEDPIEYMHKHNQSTINQREVGSDVPTFALALRAALRQAPKVILIGEMRDLETVETAMEAAETGHLVLSTLHTIDASKSIERIIGMFPKEQEKQVRTRLAQSFRYIISQRLVPKEGGGRIAVLEILKSTERTRDYILKGESEGRSLLEAIRDGVTEGMQCFDDELEKLYRQGIISRANALAFASNPSNLEVKLTLEG